MRIRFQADNDLNKAIVRAVVRREPAVDFRSAQVARFDNVPDPEVLMACAQAGRVLVSHDFQTMPDHFRAFSGQHYCPGVFLIPQDANRDRGRDAPPGLGCYRSRRMGEPAMPGSEPCQYCGRKP